MLKVEGCPITSDVDDNVNSTFNIQHSPFNLQHFSLLAFPNHTGPLFELTDDLLAKGLAASRASARKRIIYPIHRTQPAPVQRMLNFLQPGTYVKPHIHRGEGASESVVLLSGAIRYVIFDEDGGIADSFVAQAGTASAVLDMEPDVWHSFVVLEADTVIFECKKGPYSVLSDKDFAAWAPDEGTPEADAWVAGMERRLA
jgi:cupin fold WbuC family metalloprotein